MPPAEEQPCESQKQRGMMLFEEREERVIIRNTTAFIERERYSVATGAFKMYWTVVFRFHAVRALVL